MPFLYISDPDFSCGRAGGFPEVVQEVYTKPREQKVGKLSVGYIGLKRAKFFKNCRSPPSTISELA